MDTSEYYENLDKSPSYQKARKRVRQIRRFYKFLGTYILVSAFLVALNLITSPWTFWAIYPILGMGLGVGLNYIKLFGLPFVGPMDEEWEKRKLRQEIMKMDSEQHFEDWEAKLHDHHNDSLELDDDMELRDLDYKEIEKEFREKFK